MKLNKIITTITLLFTAQPVYAQITNPALGKSFGPNEGGAGLAFYVAQLWKAIVVAGGIAFLIFFLQGGLEWITAGGDKTKIESAQKKITSGLIGLAILVTSFAVVGLVGSVLKIDLLNINWSF
jgi:hypothetical protein